MGRIPAPLRRLLVHRLAPALRAPSRPSSVVKWQAFRARIALLAGVMALVFGSAPHAGWYSALPAGDSAFLRPLARPRVCRPHRRTEARRKLRRDQVRAETLHTRAWYVA